MTEIDGSGPDDRDPGNEAPDPGEAAAGDADDPGSTVDPGSGTEGALVVVGTPIGNLGDLSPRAVAALAAADVVYCEDTRHSRKLFSHAAITGVRLRSLHEHNEDDRIDEVVAAVAGGRTVALVSDAGMPAVSDPGARVVAAVAAAGLIVTVVPGPSAVLTALVASGLATDRFCFEGFLPRSGRDRTARLAVVAAEARTSVLFEAPGRVAGTLGDLASVCGGDRVVVVARELTKLHEEVWRGSLVDGVAWAADGVRGEVVLVLAGAPAPPDAEVEDEQLARDLTGRLAAGARTRGAVDEVASAHGVSRRRVYELALRLKAGEGPEGSVADQEWPGPPGR